MYDPNSIRQVNEVIGNAGRTSRDGRSPTRAALKAAHLYDTFAMRGLFHRLWGMMRRRSTRLLSLAEIEKAHAIRSRNYGGARRVAITQIRGSEGRADAFDDAFYPRKDSVNHRWINIAAARYQDATLPPVELIQVRDEFYVRDGHHRISVARALGERYVDAVVTVWEVDPAFRRAVEATPAPQGPVVAQPQPGAR